MNASASKPKSRPTDAPGGATTHQVAAFVSDLQAILGHRVRFVISRV